MRVLVAALAAAALLALLAWATQRLFATAGLALGGVYPLGAILLCTIGGTLFRSLREEGEKRKIRHAFRHYLNPEVTDLVARDPGRLRLGGERREITVFFSDIRNFTSISERLQPDVLGELLNEYLGAMTTIIFRHEGLLDKYMGDAVMAFWGAPVPAQDHARRCCRAALEMVRALAALHERWRRLGLPLLEIGIGINSGEAVVGNFGSAQRFSYTAVGDDVNLASRLEGLNKHYGTTILVSERTRAMIGDAFLCREIDRVRVTGRAQAITIHELLARRADDHDGAVARRATGFAAALDAYRRQAWDEATARLETLGSEWPRDRAIPPFLARCRRLRAAPPGEGWDWVSEMPTK
jgi:adenylate cyclase